MRNSHLVVLAVAFMPFAATASAQQIESFLGGHGATVPATYRGENAGHAWHLDVWPDQAFHLLKTPLNGDDAAAFAGRWHSDGEALLLDLGDEIVALMVRNSQRLVPPGAPQDASGDLVTDGMLAPVSITLPVSGMFTYFADAPGFVHCATGLRYPVAQEGDYLALESAYLEDQSGPAEPLFVTLEATIALREQMEGPDRFSLVVDSFYATWPGEDCKRAASNPGLTGIVWRIRSLEGDSLNWSPPAREPFLSLHASEERFNASVGCNMFLGGFTADGNSLSFSQGASTMMACLGEDGDREARLATVLADVAGYSIGGRTLRLLDVDGAVRAEAEAVYLP